MDTLIQDVRYGLRMLIKNSAFSAVAVIALALGIGANTAIFSVVMAVLVRPLPFAEPDRLVNLSARNETLGVRQAYLSASDILDFRSQSQTVDQIAAWSTFPLNLRGAANPERLENILVNTNFFQTLGASPLLGRSFTPEDGREDANPVIIGYGLWQRQFGGNPALLGQTINIGSERKSFVVIGIMPAEFQFPPRADSWMPEDFDPAAERRAGRNYRALARLKSGATIEQAQAELSAIAKTLAARYPDTNAGWDVSLVKFREQLFGSARVALPLLCATVGLVLLIACTNVANLQLARAASRQKEMAIRLALGSGRGRIIRQLLTESLILAIAGGALGLLLAVWGIDGLRAFGPDSIPRLKDAAINAEALGFTTALSFLTGIIFGLVPALEASNIDLHEKLKDSGRSKTASSHSRSFQSALVVTEVALALVLLVGAGLLIKSFWRVREVSPGFETENILTAGISLSWADYDRASWPAFFQQSIERISRLPGVDSVGAVSHLPLGGRGVNLRFEIKGEPRTAHRVDPVCDVRVASPSYFETLRIPLIRGRAFSERDTTAKTGAVVITEAFAGAFFEGRDPLGSQLKIGSDLFTGEIVGVVGDVRHRGPEAEVRPEIYISYLQNTVWPVMNLVIRTSQDPSRLAASVRAEMREMDANQPVFNVKTMSEFLSESVAERRFNMLLVGAFAALAALLAAAGIYGVMSYAVAERTREIGIRLALGAKPLDVLKMVVRQGMGLTLVGISVGLGASFILTRLMSSLLYGVGATDLATFTVISALLTAVALAACTVPARRATKVDPCVALRHE
jgi:putative ABC transport system permease protein